MDATQDHFYAKFNGLTSFPFPRVVVTLKLKSQVSPTLLPIAVKIMLGFIPFPRILAIQGKE